MKSAVINHNQRASSGGFGLVEVMVSLGILMVISLAASTVIVSLKQNYWLSQRRAKALNVAEAMAEELLLRSKSDAALAVGSHTRYFDGTGTPSSEPNFYRVTWEVLYDRPKTDMIELHVQVNWVDHDRPHQLALLTARSANP